MGSTVDSKKIRDFLLYVRNKYSNPRTYRSYLCTLKVFCRDFLKRGEWVESRKFPNIKPNIITDLPTKTQLREFFFALPHDKAKAAFLVYCTSGLRATEIFDAKLIQETMAIIPVKHEQFSTKNSYISFYNAETEMYLKKVNFDIRYCEASIRRWFKVARQKTKIRITPQVLREWFCTEMALLQVPDRYTDAFTGRLPRTVLGQRYTNYSIETLRAIYEKACVTVLS